MNGPIRAGLVLMLLAGTVRAQELYFAEYQFQNPKISAMNPDGSNPHLLFAPGPAQWLPLGLTFNAATQRVIWMDSAGASEVMSANLNGSGPATLANPTGFCRGASLDALGRIYFSSNNTLRRVNADGSGEVTIYTDTSADPLGNPRVDAANAHVYVGASGEIKRMDLDGSNIKTVVRGISQPRAIGLDIQAGYIYWLDADTISDYVGRARLDDTDFSVIVDHSPGVVQSPGFTDLLVDHAGGFLFYADELVQKIFRAGLAGENAAPIYTSPGSLAPTSLVLSTGEPAQALQDCNNNLVNDDIDIANGAPDCDNNGVIDTCQVNPCPQRTFLLDQGSDAANTLGRSVGSSPDQFQVFQPFDVPAGGWTIGEVAIDGFTINYADGSGMTLKLFPDNGSGTLPDETAALATATLNFRFNTSSVNWVYAPFAATLPQGRHWVRIEANTPAVYQGSLNLGFSGLPSKSRRANGTFTSPASPIALRLIQGSSCYANCDGSTGTPVLTPNDFACFLNRYAAGETYANCDGVGGLTANDFACFLNAYAAGCS
jgi:hypothetical protein